MKPYIQNNKWLIFLIGMIIFAIAAYWGYQKLHFGFNFIDEGYHMTESWRLSKGDRLFDNKEIGPLMPYTILNSMIFKIKPDITLLEFRKIQYVTTLFAIAIFSLCLSALTQNFYYLPFIFSLFAFTGLDATGMISNLSYYTYSHLFLILYISFLLLGIQTNKQYLKKIFFLASGIFLWAIGFSLLYLGLMLIAPIFLFFLCKKFKFKTYGFSFSDLIFTLAPAAAGWLIFFGWNADASVSGVFEALNFTLGTSSHSPVQMLYSLKGITGYIGVGILLLAAYYLLAYKLNSWVAVVCSAALSVLVYFIIETSLFGIIQPYYYGWFGRPMWFSGLLIAFILVFWSKTALDIYKKRPLEPVAELAAVIMIPVTILSACMILFSSLRTLTALHAAIPSIASLSIFFIFGRTDPKKSIMIKFTILVFLLAPFYYTTAWADWRFTYFDVVPEKAYQQIIKGFGKGIRTNSFYFQLYGWIKSTAEKYSSEDDFMLSYVMSPMSHMITKRRPALNDTFIDFSSRDPVAYQKSVQIMKNKNREPAIAFVFERMPAFFPVSLTEGTYKLPTKQLQFEASNDPITEYVKTNMEFASEFIVSRKTDFVIRCYVRKGLTD